MKGWLERILVGWVVGAFVSAVLMFVAGPTYAGATMAVVWIGYVLVDWWRASPPGGVQPDSAAERHDWTKFQ